MPPGSWILSGHPPLSYSGYSVEDVLEVLPMLVINMVRMNLSNKLPAIRNKYKTWKFMKVADLAELKSERMNDLAGNK